MVNWGHFRLPLSLASLESGVQRSRRVLEAVAVPPSCFLGPVGVAITFAGPLASWSLQRLPALDRSANGKTPSPWAGPAMKSPPDRLGGCLLSVVTSVT